MSESVTSQLPDASDPSTPHRGNIYTRAATSLAWWGLRIAGIGLLFFCAAWVVGKTWSVLLPVLVAMIICTVLWPPTRWMRNHGIPAALAALISAGGAVVVIGGIVALISPSIVSQSSQLATQAADGVGAIQKWVSGPPLNVDSSTLSNATQTVINKLQESSQQIATTVLSGVGTVASTLFSVFIILMLTFFFLKDGPKFMPWLRRAVGNPAAPHIDAVVTGMWKTLGGFIRAQAIVSLIDAVLIGAGLVILNVPLAYALAVLTFLGGFVPIIGAVVAGALAVLIALVSKGVVTALIVLAIIIAVQQLEGNVLSPWLQASAMNLHPVVVLLSVTLGSSVFGIVGAFFAVPVAACAAVLLRYINVKIAERTGEPIPSDSGPKKSRALAAASKKT